MEFNQEDDWQPESNNIWHHFQKLPPMSGEEIADDMKQTRQNVSRILKKIFAQTYKRISRLERDKSPFEIAMYISQLFGVDFSIKTEVKKFFRLFPPGIKELIEKDGTARMEAGQRRLSIMR